MSALAKTRIEQIKLMKDKDNNKPGSATTTTTTSGSSGSKGSRTGSKVGSRTTQTKKRPAGSAAKKRPARKPEEAEENLLDGEAGQEEDIGYSNGSDDPVPCIPDDPIPSIPDIDDDMEDDMGDPLELVRREMEEKKKKKMDSSRGQPPSARGEKPPLSARGDKPPDSARREREEEKNKKNAAVVLRRSDRKDSTASDQQQQQNDKKGERGKKGKTGSDNRPAGSQSLRTRWGDGNGNNDARRNTISGDRPRGTSSATDDDRRKNGNDRGDDSNSEGEGDTSDGQGWEQRKSSAQDLFDYHVLSVEALEARLHTNVQNGLSAADASSKLRRDGPNHPTVKSPTIDFGEYATRKVLVRRDGYRKAVESRDLVVGDVVTIEPGLVLADMRVVAVNTTDLLIDNSVISGDPEPIPRQVDMTTENYLTSENLIFYGSSIVDGEGTGIVVRAGDGTLIARMIKDNENAKGRKEGGPKAKKAIMKQLAKNGLAFKEPNAAYRLGRVTTMVVDSQGVLTENKSSVSYVMIDREIRQSTALPEGEPTLAALMRACVLSCNAVFHVPEGADKAKLNVDNIDVEEWDNTSGALLRFYEKNPTIGLKRRDNAFCCEIMRTAWDKVADDLNDFHVSIHRWPRGAHVGGEDETKANFLAVLSGPLEVVLQNCSTYMLTGKAQNLDNAAKKEIREQAMILQGYGDLVVAFAHLPLGSSSFPHDFEFDFYSPNFPLKEMCLVGLVSMGARFYKTIPSAIERCKAANIRLIMVSQDPAHAVTVMARKLGLITKETPEDVAKREGVMVDELSPEKLEQAKAIVLDGGQMALMMEEGLCHVMRTHDEVVISGVDASQKLKIVRAAQMMRKEEVVVATGSHLPDCAGLAVADVGIATPGSVEAVQQAADAIMTGGALDSIIDAVEFVRKKGEGGSCTLQ